ncbi:hypothetical protein ACGFMM_31775 [Streptomyces sp. NPDC048604]|uniref:hypothetical protein n=1 Tax=Streptomyces sp. NPDC048604 TaxID=3365578 RepID=UPI003717A322
MYEMHVGTAPPDGTLVWHIAAKDRATALCGESLRHEHSADRDSTDRHCVPCMSSFQELLDQRV